MSAKFQTHLAIGNVISDDVEIAANSYTTIYVDRPSDIVMYGVISVAIYNAENDGTGCTWCFCSNHTSANNPIAITVRNMMSSKAKVYADVRYLYLAD